MKIIEVTSDEQEEDARRKQNPLNGGKVDNRAWDVMDDFDDELSYVSGHLKKQQPGMNPSSYHKMAIDAVVDSVSPTVVPINKLISTEPGYNADHVKTIDLNANNLPIVYQDNGMNVISDGNHRVIAAYLAGKTQVKVNLITVNDVAAVADRLATQ